jgi:hypothetical protein
VWVGARGLGFSSPACGFFFSSSSFFLWRCTVALFSLPRRPMQYPITHMKVSAHFLSPPTRLRHFFCTTIAARPATTCRMLSDWLPQLGLLPRGAFSIFSAAASAAIGNGGKGIPRWAIGGALGLVGSFLTVCAYGTAVEWRRIAPNNRVGVMYARGTDYWFGRCLQHVCDEGVTSMYLSTAEMSARCWTRNRDEMDMQPHLSMLYGVHRAMRH